MMAVIMEEEKAAEINLQWKGTDACYDFYCPCGWRGPDDPRSEEIDTNHRDGYFQQWFTCGGCHRVWWLPNKIVAVEVKKRGEWPEDVVNMAGKAAKDVNEIKEKG
jgi:hypothetical protein